MENIKIQKDQITIKSQSATSKAILRFLIENLTPEIKLTIFRQENPTNIRVPAQLNTYMGHKIMGTYDNNSKIFDAFGIEEEDMAEIMTHKGQVQWKDPFEP